MRVLWTSDAENDLREILLYIGREDPAASKRFNKRIRMAIDRLSEHPWIGRRGAVEGTRELIPHPNYRVVYEILSDSVRVAAIVHATRKWPPEEGRS